VQLKVKETIGQDPWLSFPTLPAVYFAARTKPEDPGPERQIEIAFWESVKSNKDPAVLDAYLERYPKGEFAPTARALIAQYELQLAERAARKEETRQQAEASKVSEPRRLEEERQAHEAALAAEQRRAEELKGFRQAKQQEETNRAKLAAGANELRKALEEIRIAREAAKAADEQRAAAIRAAEDAKSRAKLASLPPDGDQKRYPENIAADPLALTRALQTELRRVGCDPGDVNGAWGDKAKAALDEFARVTKVTLPSYAPTAEALQAVRGQRGRICPLVCGLSETERDGKCVRSVKANRSAKKNPSKSETVQGPWRCSPGGSTKVPEATSRERRLYCSGRASCQQLCMARGFDASKCQKFCTSRGL
jgi:hypothetical protein